MEANIAAVTRRSSGDPKPTTPRAIDSSRTNTFTSNYSANELGAPYFAIIIILGRWDCYFRRIFRNYMVLRSKSKWVTKLTKIKFQGFV